MLAASTTLTGPTFALAAQPGAIRLAQAEEPGAEAGGGAAGEAPVKPRRQTRQAQPEAGEAGSAEGGEAQPKQRRKAQAEQGESEQPARRQRGAAENAEPSAQTGAAASDAEQPSPRRQRKEAPAATAAGEAETSGAAAADPDAAPQRRKRPQPAEGETSGAAGAASESGEQAPRRNGRNRQEQQPGAASEAPAEPTAASPAEGETKQRPAGRRQKTEPAEAPVTAAQPAEPSAATTQPAEPQAPEGQPGSQRRQRQREQAGEAAPAPEKAPAKPGSATRAAPAETAAPATTPDASAPRSGNAAAPTGEVPAQPATPGTPAAPATAAPNASAQPGAPDATTAVPGTAQPLAPGQRAPAQAPAAGTTAPAAPTAAGAPAASATPAPQPVPADIQTAPVQPGRIDQSDARVQTLQTPVDVQPITRERGERIREAPRYELPPDAKVVKRDGDRQILSLGAAAVAGAVAGATAGYFIRSNDDDRLEKGSREQYSERLPRGRTRDTIVKENGVQIVTVTNRYGDVIQRSRVMPDGREVVLFYDPDSADERRPDYFEDPGRDLPPVRVDIPEDEYVVDTDEPDEQLYYNTLVAPPVETVERIYSIDEVRRSPRIREKVRRIDLATINFDFASATILQDQVDKLQGLAEAIDKVVKANPGETFLIEGHTDAVGSPEANLVLSDKRAESVASALTQYFDVPAENLVTQGYGEQELKVNTEGENRENRRVTVRRITALVKPVETSGR
ncbi:OmpA family protein [Aureimonas leprariae]|uniref:OmpA family protein n=2 Tax=Plantimonas leprariae TaxID=2615207 RepID=A0A7V7PR67_9HYPH|nr:OmpA family protein [Aureimonas leprariae]